mgnify:CR=1 FL=1
MRNLKCSLWGPAVAIPWALALSSCSADDNPAPNQQADAGAAGSGGAGATDGGGPGDGAGDTTSAGACLGAGDTAALGSADLDAEIPTCVKALVTGGKGPQDPDFPQLVSACLVKSTGLTTGCADCYAHFADCSAEQCLAQCIADPTAKQCVDCRCGISAATDCVGALVSCTGVKDDTCG